MTPVSLHALLIEDSSSDAKLVVLELRKLGRPVEWERVETADALRAALEKRPWDIIISDWSMPRFDAPAALRIANDLAPDVPFIIVSGTVGEEAAVEAMRAGAHDYIRKDKLGRLTAVVERELRESEIRKVGKLTLEALRESERRFACLSDSGLIGIISADLLGNLFDVNDAHARMLGYSREEMMSGAMRWTDITPLEWKGRDEAALKQLRETGAAPPWEKELFSKDGRRVPVLIGVAMLEYPKVVAFSVDLTAQKQAESARAAFAVKAQKEQSGRLRAEEALRQSEEQLRHAQKMEAVGRLAGGVAHDFNNLLSVILGYSSLALEKLDKRDPLYAGQSQISAAAERAASLTRQLLLFSRQQVMEPRVISLNDLIKGIEKMIGRMVGEDIDIVCLPGESAGRIRGDYGHLEQVVMNLVVNARDAMPSGGTVTIETANIVLDHEYAESHLAVKPGEYVMLAVSDTGTGMDKATQARIFEPFFTTKELGKGTGLGLSTVFGIIQQCGGSIWVYSELQKGTTFKIYLPRVDADLDPLHTQRTPIVLRGTETILLVEDEEAVRNVVQSILVHHGYRVLVAPHAGEALLLCETEPGKIDLLITDVVMPHMSGPELADRLLARLPDLKVLCMSGYTDDSVRRRGLLERCVNFLQKPITPTSLILKVREVLDGPATNKAN